MADSAVINARPAIKVDGATSTDMQDSLTGMVINLPLNGMAHAELVLTNWGPTKNAGEVSYLFQDVALGKTLEISMGEDDQHRLFKGEITALEERYGDAAPPQLYILLEDKLHRLARKRQSRVFDEKTPDDIVQAIAADAGLTADANVSSVTATFHQLNESDLAFLTRLLSSFGIAVRLVDDTLRARPEEPDAEPFELTVDNSVLAVRLIADLNHQHGKTKVMGFNTDIDEPVEHEVSSLSSPPDGTTAAQTLDQLGWPAEEIVPQPFAISSGEADAFARAHFDRQAKRFISGELRCKGEPTLRSGREIKLSGVSDRMAGVYQIVHCAHRFDNATGYETHMKVNRAGWPV